MKISEFIIKLEEVKKEHGDLNVVISESHEYWGSVQRHYSEPDIRVTEHAQPEGPKSGKQEKALLLEY